MIRWDADDPFRLRLSAAAGCYRYDGDTDSALKIEAVLHKLDHDRPVRTVDLEAAEALADAKLAEGTDRA